MIAMNFRAAATALVLGTAALAVATPADAALRASVGKPLQEAQSLAKSGNYAAACSKVKQAEGVGGLSGEESKVTKQMRDYLAAASKGSACAEGSSVGAEAKFQADWQARRYNDVIADEELLRRNGVLSGNAQVVIAQAYEQKGDYQGCVRYASEHSGVGGEMIKRGMLCAYKTGNDALSLDLALKLVAMNPSQENWGQLLRQAERTKQLTDPQTLDIYRLKFLTENMKGADDYFTLAQLLLAARLPSEANAVVQKGITAKLLVDQRAQRLIGLVKQSMAGDVANIGKAQAAAQKAPKGDELVKVGEDLTGMGKYPEAISAIQAGIAKGVADPDNAQVRLAVAYYGAKQKGPAVSALEKANKTPNGKMVSKLWSLYIRNH